MVIKMKKIIFTLALCVAACLCLNAQAQKAKFGYVDYAAVIQSLPETKLAEDEVKALKADLEKEGEQLQNEFYAKYQELQQGNYSSAAVQKVKQQEVQDMYKRVQSFAEAAEEQLSKKQQDLLAPISEKVLAAIKEIAKAGGYAYIFDKTTPLYANDTIDLTEQVKAKLAEQK